MSLKTIVASFTAASLMACTLGLSGPAFAQNSQKQLDIAAARAQRKATVGANMNLTADEASKFWPVYDAYEKRMDSIEDRHVKELKDFAAKYNNFTDADAKKKLDEVMAIAAGAARRAEGIHPAVPRRRLAGQGDALLPDRQQDPGADPVRHRAVGAAGAVAGRGRSAVAGEIGEGPMLENRSMPACSVIPVLGYPDVGAAVDWLRDAFGFKLRLRIANHRAQMDVGDGAIVVAQRSAVRPAKIVTR